MLKSARNSTPLPDVEGTRDSEFVARIADLPCVRFRKPHDASAREFAGTVEAQDALFLFRQLKSDSRMTSPMIRTEKAGLRLLPGHHPLSVNVSNPYAGFVLRINSTASAITMASYLPGTDVASGVATDSTGNLWITGSTSETTLPVSANAYQKTPTISQSGSSQSGYIMELNSGATSVLKATYLDGASKAYEEYSSFARIALDSHSNVFAGGTTGSMDFPLVNPFMTEFETASFYGDMVVAGMSPDLSTVKFGSFFSSVDPAL